jgi:hypothetical protein
MHQNMAPVDDMHQNNAAKLNIEMATSSTSAEETKAPVRELMTMIRRRSGEEESR